MSSPVALVIGRLTPVRGPRVTSQLAGQEGLEPPTAGFGDRDSSQLSYCPVAVLARQALPGHGVSQHHSAGMHRPLVDRHQLMKCTLPDAPASNHCRNRPMIIPVTGISRGI